MIEAYDEQRVSCVVRVQSTFELQRTLGTANLICHSLLGMRTTKMRSYNERICTCVVFWGLYCCSLKRAKCTGLRLQRTWSLYY